MKTAHAARHYIRNRYFVWRHGQSRANKEGIIISSLRNGASSFGLTERGLEEIRTSAVRMRGRVGQRILLFSSPFLRCIESAQVIAEEIGVNSIVVAPELRERYFGAFEKRQSRYYRRVYRSDTVNPHRPFRGVESVSDVRERVTKFVYSLEQTYRDSNIILVTHADVGEILQTAYMALPPYFHRKLPKLKNGECRELHVC